MWMRLDLHAHPPTKAHLKQNQKMEMETWNTDHLCYRLAPLLIKNKLNSKVNYQLYTLKYKSVHRIINMVVIFNFFHGVAPQKKPF